MTKVTITATDAAGNVSAAKAVTITWGNPQPPAGRRIGVYMSGNNTGLDAYTSGWAKKPNQASFYLNWNSSLPALMNTYAGQGRTLQVSMSTKISAGSWVLWSDVAAGQYDTRIVAMVRALDALGVRVLLSLDVEPDGQYQLGTSAAGVAPNQTPAQYVAAANHFADLIHMNSTRVESAVWLAGFQSAAVSMSFLPAKAKLDNVSWDPYSTGSNTAAPMPAQRWAIFINSVLIPAGYTTTRRHLFETGIKVDPFSGGGQYTIAQQIAFYQAVPAAMDLLGIESVVWFRANSGSHDYIPLDPSVDAAFRDMLAASI